MKVMEFSCPLQVFGAFFSLLLIANFSYGVWVKEDDLENLLHPTDRQAAEKQAARWWSNKQIQKKVQQLKTKANNLNKQVDLSNRASLYSQIDRYSVKTQNNLYEIKQRYYKPSQ